MPDDESQLEQGDIVWAEVSDPQGRNPKVRPLVVLTRSSEIPQVDTVYCIFVTGTYTEPLPDSHIELPWDPNGHPRTNLRKRSFAKCDSVYPVAKDSIESVAGTVPAKWMYSIVEKVKELGCGDYDVG